MNGIPTHFYINLGGYLVAIFVQRKMPD